MIVPDRKKGSYEKDQAGKVETDEEETDDDEKEETDEVNEDETDGEKTILLEQSEDENEQSEKTCDQVTCQPAEEGTVSKYFKNTSKKVKKIGLESFGLLLKR